MSEAFLCAEAVVAGSRLDRFEPRTRVVAAVAVIVVVLAVRSLPLLAGLVPVALIAARLAGVGLADLARRLAHVEGFLVVLALLLPLTVPGPAAVAFGPIALSQPGLERAVAIVLRVNLSAIALFTLIGGLEPIRLGHALARLGMPEKLVHLLLFAARWVGLVAAEARRLDDALRVRGFRARPSAHGLRTLAHFIGQLLVRAFERAERVEEAMRCRAFAGRFALVDEGRVTRRDAVFAVGLGLVLLAVLVVDRSS